ncbi:MAG: sulfotransferase [Chloroflexota bacterium]|nr:sulfotransferase [Chloroflexota bacterium]
MNSKTPLIIAGMHRSGTSLIARFVHHSGVDLGNHLVGPKESNPYGHFEDVEILDFHRRILVREFGDSMWVPGPPHIAEEDRKTAAKLIAARRHKRYWGWKEPRTSLFLDLWNGLLPDAHFLFVVRHPLLVLDSLSRRTKSKFYHFWKHGKFLRSWMIYNRECAHFYRQHTDRCMLVMLRDVAEAPNAFIKSLSDWLSMEFDPGKFQALYEPRALSLRRDRLLFSSRRLRSESAALHDELRREADTTSIASAPPRV